MNETLKLKRVFAQAREEIESAVFDKLCVIEDAGKIRQVFEKLLELEQDINAICDELFFEDLAKSLNTAYTEGKING